LPDAPRAVPDVPFSRLRFRSHRSGMRCLAGLRAAVESCPLSWAFPTAESDARYESPTAYGGLPCHRTPPPACPLFHGDAQVPAVIRVRGSPAVPPELSPIHQRFPRAGTLGASHVLRRLSSCLPRSEDSGGPPPPRPVGWASMACGSVQTLGVRHSHVAAARILHHEGGQLLGLKVL
jgi:hypothetical protein